MPNWPPNFKTGLKINIFSIEPSFSYGFIKHNKEGSNP